MASQRTIGIVGGVGPEASVYTMQKVFDNTKTVLDQDHLPVILISKPEIIEDRSKFLLSQSGCNPGYSILSVITLLEKAGADIIGIPCNTAHAEKIMSVIIEGLQRQKSKVQLINIIDEVIQYIKINWPDRNKVGILVTNGMYYDGEYVRKLEANGYKGMTLCEESQNGLLNDSIYNPEYGIKALGFDVPDKVRKNIEICIEELITYGAQVIVLGCTELPMIIRGKQYKGIPILDSADILARALVREANKNKLK